MHPAPSIIAFTVLAGLGYGLAFVLGFGVLDPAAIATRVAHILALALISTGLMSSVLHLGNPQRAWRALSQWRSSWLSREGVLAIVTFLPLVVAGWGSVVEGRYIAWAGLLGSVGCVATVFCTSMIYASLKSVDAWHTGWTTVCFLLFALAGGLTAACLFASLAGISAVGLAATAIAATVAAWSAKHVWRSRLKTLSPTSTAETATGLGYMGKVRQFEPPHMTANYLTREMGFKVARKHADKLSVIAALSGGSVAIVMLLIVIATSQTTIAVVASTIALLAHFLGVIVERWLFFAEARHSVMSYYGS